MRYFSYLFILLLTLTVANSVYADCDVDKTYVVPLPPPPTKSMEDYPRSKRPAVYQERLKAMRLWLAANEK